MSSRLTKYIFVCSLVPMEIRKNPHVDVIQLYLAGLSMNYISAQSGVTRQAIWKRLQAAGISATRRSGRVPSICEYCGKDYPARRTSRTSTETTQRMCSKACYYASRSNPSFQESRSGGKRSRYRVAHHFELKNGHVVHHEDQNQNNDELLNLRVFASQSDHLKYHHGKAIVPLWDGRRCRCAMCKMLARG